MFDRAQASVLRDASLPGVMKATTRSNVPGRVRMRGITPIDEVYEEDPRMRKLFRKHFAIVVRRCAFRDLPADLSTHVASFLMPDVAWFLM